MKYLNSCNGDCCKDPTWFLKETSDIPAINAFLTAPENAATMAAIRVACGFLVEKFSPTQLTMPMLLTAMTLFHDWQDKQLSKKVTGDDLIAELRARTGIQMPKATEKPEQFKEMPSEIWDSIPEPVRQKIVDGEIDIWGITM